MATTSDYINALTDARDDLVDQLRAGGVDAEDDSTFTSLVPKVAQVNVIQYDELPDPSEDLVGTIVQYVGETAGDLTKGYFYYCRSEGEAPDPITYSWENIQVQAGSGGEIFIYDANATAEEQAEVLAAWVENYNETHEYANLIFVRGTRMIAATSCHVDGSSYVITFIGYPDGLDSMTCAYLSFSYTNGNIIFHVRPTTVSARTIVERYGNGHHGALPDNNTIEFTPTGDYNPATKKYVDDVAASISSLEFEVVEELPAEGDTGKIYLVKNPPKYLDLQVLYKQNDILWLYAVCDGRINPDYIIEEHGEDEYVVDSEAVKLVFGGHHIVESLTLSGPMEFIAQEDGETHLGYLITFADDISSIVMEYGDITNVPCTANVVEGFFINDSDNRIAPEFITDTFLYGSPIINTVDVTGDDVYAEYIYLSTGGYEKLGDLNSINIETCNNEDIDELFVLPRFDIIVSYLDSTIGTGEHNVGIISPEGFELDYSKFEEDPEAANHWHPIAPGYYAKASFNGTEVDLTANSALYMGETDKGALMFHITDEMMDLVIANGGKLRGITFNIKFPKDVLVYEGAGNNEKVLDFVYGDEIDGHSYPEE